jgi:hypothetical protein
VLLNDWYDYITMINEWMSMACWCTGGNMKYREQNLPQGHFVYHTPHFELGLHLSCAGRGQWLTAWAMAMPFGEISALVNVQILKNHYNRFQSGTHVHLTIWHDRFLFGLGPVSFLTLGDPLQIGIHLHVN